MSTLYCTFQGPGHNGQLDYFTYSGVPFLDIMVQRVPNLGMSASPALAYYNTQIYCAHQSSGNTGQLAVNILTGNSWSGDCQVLSQKGVTGSPALAVFQGKLYCVHQGEGNSGQLWYTTFDGTQWTDDQQISGVSMSASPALAVYQAPGDIPRLYCAYQGPGHNGQLLYAWTVDGTNWTVNLPIDNAHLTDSPALAVYQAPGDIPQLYCLHQGEGINGQLWWTRFDGRNWTGDQQVQNVGISASPALAVYQYQGSAIDPPGPSLLYCLHQGEGNNGQLWFTTFDNTGWHKDELVGGVQLSESPSVCVGP